MSLNPQEKAHLKVLVQSSQWSVVQKIANELCEKVSNEGQVYDSEWNVVQATLLRDGQIKGIRRFIQELFANIE